MDKATEIKLIEELQGLHAQKSAFLTDAICQRSVEDYFDPGRFSKELSSIFRVDPVPAVHSSELPDKDSFLRREVAGLPVLFTRDSDGMVHAFLNVCLHRGTRLVDSDSGCAGRFSCPYHAWTWNNQGKLIAIPHEKQGFSGIDRSTLGLRRLGCEEEYGWLWVNPADDEKPDVEKCLYGLSKDFSWLDAGELHLLHSDVQVRTVNWKIIVEGGIESYHFRIAHRDTIAPYFHDNLSSYMEFGPHLRSILARRSLTDIADQPTESWRLRDHAQVLYNLFPATSLLVQSDHIAWIQLEPLSASSTRIRLSTLVPKYRVTLDTDLAHWEKNHVITVKTLKEDFDIGESIQSGLASGANDRLTFGRFEGALAVFNKTVDSKLQTG